jgi:polysaccharide biosynthesis protein PslJ
VTVLPDRVTLLSPTATNTAGDAVTFLTIYIVLLLGLPSRYVFGPLGSAGTPAQILGMGALLWWVGHYLSRTYTVVPVSDPIRRAMLGFGAAVLASYAVAMVRPIDAVEMRAADRGLLTLCAWLGIFVVASDGIPSRARLDVLLRRLALGGGLIAVLGLLQFQTGMALTNYLKLPGLTENSELRSLGARDGFVRPAGTALHAIEFGVVLAMLLPIAIHYAIHDTDKSTLRRWFPAGAIVAAVPISISRSAVVCTIVVMAMLLPTWQPAVRRVAYVCSVGLLAATYVLVPGMLGAMTRMFTGIANDGSALSRTDSYAVAAEMISRAPVFGRGFSTFLPAYRILDNQYLAVVIEMGVVGLAAILTLFAVGLSAAMGVRRRSRDQPIRQLAQALAASLAAGVVSLAFFDAFSFPMVAGLIFFLLGVISALRKLHFAGLVTIMTPANSPVTPGRYLPP